MYHERNPKNTDYVEMKIEMMENGTQYDSIKGEGLVPETAEEPIAVSDMLMDFTDILFFNFNTNRAAQKAIARLASYLQLSKVCVCTSTENRSQPMRVLYTDDSPTDAHAPMEEKSLHSINGDTYVYRVYRRSTAKLLSMEQRRVLEFLFKTLHTYLNRQVSLDTAQLAQTHDMLFHCLNTNGFRQTLAAHHRNGMDFSRYAAAFMNVQKFKAINAKVGFENGNTVIRHIIATFRNLLDKDECFARIGGDNFSVFLRQDKLQQTLDALNAISLEIPHNGSMHRIEVNFRMGIYCIEHGVNDINEILENASIAYGFARQSTQDDILYYSEEKRSELEYRKMLEGALRPALQNGEFLVYLQPKVSLADGKLVGAEALSRWNNHGVMMCPDSYIPIFERNGRITEIDFYVFHQVCTMLRQWIDSGLTPVTVSVNFSKITLESPDFVSLLVNIVKSCDVPVRYLEVEFTETFCMEDEQKFQDTLAQLKACGFSVSLDDFGKGYSSINMLKNMDFDVLKLDRTFLCEDAPNSHRGSIILKSIIRMAQNLNIQVIAEGVETAEQVAHLRELRCEKAQGYYFDRPLPSDVFIERLQNGQYQM